MLRYVVNYDFSILFSHSPAVSFSSFSWKCEMSTTNKNCFNLDKMKRLRHLTNRNWRHDIVLFRSLSLSLSFFQFSTENCAHSKSNIAKIRAEKIYQKSQNAVYCVSAWKSVTILIACMHSFRSECYCFRRATVRWSELSWVVLLDVCMPANIFRIRLYSCRDFFSSFGNSHLSWPSPPPHIHIHKEPNNGMQRANLRCNIYFSHVVESHSWTISSGRLGKSVCNRNDVFLFAVFLFRFRFENKYFRSKFFVVHFDASERGECVSAFALF